MDDEGEMVAEGGAVAEAGVGAAGLQATILFVFFHQEVGIVDAGGGS